MSNDSEFCKKCTSSAICFNHGCMDQPAQEQADPVDGDMLPPVGAKVLIHLGRQDAWVEHTVTGYYVWPACKHQVRDGEQDAHRVFVRVKDAKGYDNARLLSKVKFVGQAAPQAPVAAAPVPNPPEFEGIKTVGGQQAHAGADEADAQRYRWLKERFTGYDCYWMGTPPYEAEEDKGKCVIVFECGQDFEASRHFERSIDAAIRAAQEGEKS